MSEQLQKRLSREQVVAILQGYVIGEVSSSTAMHALGLQRTRFFELVQRYRIDPEGFVIAPPPRANDHRRINPSTETRIVQELEREHSLIADETMPVTTYNYSAVRDDLVADGLRVSLPTIIARAKEHGYYLPRRPRRTHDREVITTFAGELVQHDSSHHRWSPFMTEKLYLITSLDDFSRTILYADFVEKETSWAHIKAAEYLLQTYGCPLKYYPDQHAIFRYVKDRDKVTPWQTAKTFTDEVDPQFKQVLKDCGVDLIYALSPQAKGKIERPYRWLQDRVVRTAAKERITDIVGLRRVLGQIVRQYNHVWIHSTTKEVPSQRLQRAIDEKRSLFRPFLIPEPYLTTSDIFALRDQRVVNAYRKISLRTLELKVPHVEPRQTVDLRIVPHAQPDVAEVRMWWHGRLVGTHLVRHEDINLNV